MTFEERVNALGPWRLTARQARFVVTVALNSGYCLRRQYAAFAGVQYGRVVRDFLDGLVSGRMATRVAYRIDRGFLYHVHARRIYRALQEEDNQNRRRTTAAGIARKLMLLDVVIGQPDVGWIATEADKVALFTQRFGLSARDLPQRAYAAYDQRASATTRYFVHKLPIFVQGDPPCVNFVVPAIDPSGQVFEQWLHDHARLLSQLPSWALMVVSPAGGFALPVCRSVFDRYVAGVSAAPTIRDRYELARYFITRRAVEAKEFSAVSVADLNHFREARPRFATPIVESLYARWLAEGERVLGDLDDRSREAATPRGTFLARELPYTYEAFGKLEGRH